MNRVRQPKRFQPLPVLFVSILGSLLLSSCGPFSQNDPTGTPLLPTVTAAGTAPTATALPPDTATLAPPSPTSTPEVTPPPTAVFLPDPSQIEELASLLAWVTAARQQEQPPGDVADLLLASGWMRPAAAYAQVLIDTAAPFAAADLDGDGQEEWVLTITTDGAGRVSDDAGGGMSGPLVGELWLVNQQGRIHRIAQIEDFGNESAPVTIAQEDMTGDGRPDILTQMMGCGAHTCIGTFHLLTGHGGSVHSAVDLTSASVQEINAAAPGVDLAPRDYLSDPSGVTISYPTVTLADQNGDGVVDLLLSGGTIGSAGAGIHRGYDEMWAWSGTTFTLADFRFWPSAYRHHELYDGMFAQALRRRAVAWTHYLRVIVDDTLNDEFAFEAGTYPDPAAAGRAATRQMAAFRMGQMALEEGHRGIARVWATWLEETYPGSAIGTALNLLVDRVQVPDEVPAGCAAAAAYLESQPNPLGVLADGVGYGNPSLSAADICSTFPIYPVDDRPAAAHPPGTQIGDAALDTLIGLALAHDTDGMLEHLNLLPRPCTTELGLGAIPCFEGEPEGTLIPVLAFVGCEGGNFRDPEAIRRNVELTLARVAGLYAVVINPESGETSLIFTAPDAYGVVILDVEDGGVTQLNIGCEWLPGLAMSWKVIGAEVMLAPPYPSG